MWSWFRALFAADPPTPPAPPRRNTEDDILPCFNRVRRITTPNAFHGAVKSALVNKGTGRPIHASIHFFGDCKAGKSQLFNAVSCTVNGSLQGMSLRDVGAFISDNQQCSLYPCRMAFSRLTGAAGWNRQQDGEVYLNDNRGNDEKDIYTLRAIEAAVQGKLAPSEAFPLDTTEAADRARAQISGRARNSNNVHATYVVYCVPAKKLMNSAPDSPLWAKIKRVMRGCKGVQHPGCDHATELRFLLNVTCVDELSTDSDPNPIRPIDLLCPISRSPNAALRGLAKTIKDNIGLEEDSIAVIGFLGNLKERVFDYSDFLGNNNANGQPDYAIMALRYWVLEMITGSSSWISTNEITQAETAGNQQ